MARGRAAHPPICVYSPPSARLGRAGARPPDEGPDTHPRNGDPVSAQTPYERFRLGARRAPGPGPATAPGIAPFAGAQTAPRNAQPCSLFFRPHPTRGPGWSVPPARCPSRGAPRHLPLPRLTPLTDAACATHIRPPGDPRARKPENFQKMSAWHMPDPANIGHLEPALIGYGRRRGLPSQR
jgi:hypothetical protein